MGICATKTHQQRQNYQQQDQEPQKQAIEPIPQTPHSLLGQLTEIKSQLEPKEYDYKNPHRQYNVLIEGVLFDVVNSMEGPLKVPQEEPIQNNNEVD